MLVYSDKSEPIDLPRNLEARDQELSQTMNAVGLVLRTFIPRISVRAILLPRSSKHQHAQLLLESFAWHLLATNPNKDFYRALVELAGRAANPARLPFNGPEISFTVEAEKAPLSAHDQIQALQTLQHLISLPGRDAESMQSWFSKTLEEQSKVAARNNSRLIAR